MHTLKSVHPSIFTLVPDIWAMIAPHLPGEQFGRLKLTGSKYLWSCLKFPGVVKSVKLGKDYLQFESWPAFLDELPSIVELSIHSPDKTWWSEFGIKLSKIPSTLRKLKISGKISYFDSFFSGDEGDQLYLSEHVPHLESLDFSKVMVPTHCWVQSWPQNLTKLKVYEWASDIPLPPSLKILLVTSEIHFRRSTDLKLPLDLETVWSFRTSDFGKLVSLLPPGVQKLGTSYECMTDSSFTLDRLPRDITHLACSARLTQLPHSVELLPQHLTYLKLLTVLPAASWPLLPPTLQYLNFVISPGPDCASVTKTILDQGSPYDFCAYPLHLLPIGITELKLHLHAGIESYLDFSNNYDPSNVSNPMFLPKLTKLKAKSFHLSSNAVMHLPASLTSLAIHNFCEEVCKHLPRSLTYLSARKALMSPNVFKFLPKSLTYLQLQCLCDKESWIDTATGNFRDKNWPLLLEHNGYASNLTWRNDQALPSGLINLNFDFFEHLGDSFAQQHLPNLKSFEVPSSMNFTNIAIPLLSRHLTVLDLSKSSRITGSCFPHLPRTLTHLMLDSASAIFDGDIQHLPRCLNMIYFDEAIHLTELCIRYLPPQLELLKLSHNIHIPISSFLNLPYPIRSRSAQSSPSFETKRWSVSYGKIVDY